MNYEREAIYLKKFKQLYYFDSLDTGKWINCQSVSYAKKIIKNSRIEQALSIDLKGN